MRLDKKRSLGEPNKLERFFGLMVVFFALIIFIYFVGWSGFGPSFNQLLQINSYNRSLQPIDATVANIGNHGIFKKVTLKYYLELEALPDKQGEMFNIPAEKLKELDVFFSASDYKKHEFKIGQKRTIFVEPSGKAVGEKIPWDRPRILEEIHFAFFPVIYGGLLFCVISLSIIFEKKPEKKLKKVSDKPQGWRNDYTENWRNYR